MERSNDEEARQRSLTPDAIVPVLACVLNQLCARNDQLPVDQTAITKFHALKPPSISIRDYLERISKYAACSGECFVLSLVYVDRIIQNNHSFVVNSLNVHRLLITSIMLAAKFFDDQYFNNAYYAKVGGVPCGEMNSLEIEFLFMLNFNLFGATETFQQYYIELCKHTLNSPCDCHSGPSLFTLKTNGLLLEYDLTRRISHSTILMTPSPDTDVKMDPDSDSAQAAVASSTSSSSASSSSVHPQQQQSAAALAAAAPAGATYAYGLDPYSQHQQQFQHYGAGGGGSGGGGGQLQAQAYHHSQPQVASGGYYQQHHQQQQQQQQQPMYQQHFHQPQHYRHYQQ